MQDGSFETKHIKMKVRGLSNNINYFSNVRLYNISKNYILILQLCKSVNFFQKKTLKKSKNIFQILSKNNTLFFYVIFRKKPL